MPFEVLGFTFLCPFDSRPPLRYIFLAHGFLTTAGTWDTPKTLIYGQRTGYGSLKR